VLVRFAYLAVSHAFAALRLLRMTDREKDVEILALRHQLTVLHRQLGDRRPRLRPEDRALLAALLVPLSRATLRRLRLLVSPDTVLRWHRDLEKPPRPCKQTPRAWASTHGRIHPPPRPAPGKREPLLGVSAHSRRTHPAWHSDRSLHRVGDPQDRGRRPSPAPDDSHLGRLSALAGRGGPGDGLHRNGHAYRAAPVPNTPRCSTRSSSTRGSPRC
jgi:hypothetical protein